MAKLNEQAAQELPLNGEFPAVTGKAVNRHIAVAINHMKKRRDALTIQRDKFQREIEQIGTAIMALEPEPDDFGL